jgi:YVTN family beta-propeller protein
VRFAVTFALLLATAGYTSIANAQDGNLAEPSIDTQPIDLSAQQSPWGRPNIDITHHDRVYSAGDSPSITVTDPSKGMVLGVIPLYAAIKRSAGESEGRAPFSPAFGYAPDGRTLAVTSRNSDLVAFLDTRSNSVVHTATFGGSPAGVSYAPKGREIWVPVRGGNYISVLAAKGFAEIARLATPGEPGMMVFSNNGRYAYVCMGPSTAVFDVAKRSIVASVPQGGRSCPSIAASPDGKQIWLTSMDAGHAVAFSAKPPFKILRVVDTGPGTSNVNFVSNDDGQFAYVAVGGLNAVKVFDTQTFENVATIPVGMSPRGVWPSGDGSRVYVALDKDKALAVIDTARMNLVGSVKVGQAAQAVAYVPYAVRSGRGEMNLQSGVANASPAVLSRDPS